MPTLEIVKVQDAAWIGTALLQHERGPEADFTVEEILERARQEGLGVERPGVRQHIYGHAVAGAPPHPNTARYFTTTRRGRRRLFRRGDACDPGRLKGPVRPEPGDIPSKYHHLVDWYDREYDRAEPRKRSNFEGLEEMRRISTELGIWKGIDPDEYIREQRAGWDEPDDYPGADHPVDISSPGPAFSARWAGLLKVRQMSMEAGYFKGVDPDEYIRELRADWPS